VDGCQSVGQLKERKTTLKGARVPRARGKEKRIKGLQKKKTTSCHSKTLRSKTVTQKDARVPQDYHETFVDVPSIVPFRRKKLVAGTTSKVPWMEKTLSRTAMHCHALQRTARHWDTFQGPLQWKRMFGSEWIRQLINQSKLREVRAQRLQKLEHERG